MQQQNGTPATSASEDSTAQALEEYLAAAEAGTAPPREQFLARYPELAEDLDGCLAALDFIGRAAEGPRSVVAEVAGAVPPEQPLGQLGDFRILREVGRGGMGVVYEAEQVSLGRRVALKVLPFAATMDPRQLQRFHNEARAAASLDHPHIVHVHAVGCERAVHFYAMQFIEGQTLAAVIADLRQRGGWPASPDARPTTAHVPEAPAAPSGDTAPRAAASTVRTPLDRAHFRRVAELGIQAAEALDHAHTLGIVHRDVKPANLLVDERGGLWVTDFGLAHIQSDARLTMTGDLVGTLRYMSPEQALAKRVVVDHRTDVYSLGATLYELLTLEPAFPGSDRQELLQQIAFDEPKAPRRINKALPAELETIVQKAMEKNPADRYATAKELADDLGRFLADEPIRARPAGVVRRLRKWARRHPAAVAAAAAALTAIVVVLSGAIGWVANDRAMRTQRTTDEIRTALKESAEWQQRRRVPEALSAAHRAQAALVGGHANAELRRSVEGRVLDLELLAKLEEARLASTTVKDRGFDWELADRRYGEIFQEFHLDMDGWSAEEAGKHLRDSSVALELAALLDEWAMVRRRLSPQDKARWKHLLDVARAADPDVWRNQVRDALAKKDWNALVTLASADEAAQLLPCTLSAVGSGFLGANKLKPAEAVLRKAQQRHPDDFWINFILAEVISNDKDPLGNTVRVEQAIQFQRVCVALRPQSAATRVNLGKALHDQKDVDGAIAEFRKAIELDPKYAMAHCNLGIALKDKGKLDEAVAAYRKALELKPDSAPFLTDLGDALELKRQLHGAIAAYRKAIAFNPKYVRAHVGLGKALFTKKGIDGAIAEFRKAIDIDPMNVHAHYSLGIALKAKGQLGGAIAAYRKAIDIDPKHADAHNNIGVLLAKGQLDLAIAEFRKAIDINPKHADAHNNIGGVLQAKGQLDLAIAEYRKAIDIDPKHAGAHYNLGNALKDKGQLDGAIAAYRKAIDIDPKDADAHNNIGGVLQAKGQLDLAIAEYRKAIDIDPKHAGAHYNLGNALKDKGQLDGAIAEYRKAIDIHPKSALTHYNLGVALKAKGLLDEAIAAYRKAIDIDPKFAKGHNNLGVALKAKGLLDEAIAAYRKAIDIDPKFAEAHCNLGHGLRDQGRFTEALTYLRRGHELGSRKPRWPYPSAQWVKRCERLVELDGKLPAILSGKEQPANALEHVEYAQACMIKHQYASAARLYRQAIAAKPDLVSSPGNGLRYNAACAAALAGNGAGKDAAKLTDAERAGFRKQALDWLRADLDAWGWLLVKEPGKAAPVVAQQMQHWQNDPDFKGMRGQDALGKLPKAERKEWQKLWADVAKTLARAQAKTASDQRPRVK